MKRIIIVIFLLTSFYIYSQDRVNTTGYRLISTSKEIKKAKFWSQGFDGTWRWRFNNYETNTDNVGKDDNFISIYNGEIEYQGSVKYVFFRQYWKGEFYYPNLRRDWVNYKMLKGAVIDSITYNKIKNIQIGESLDITSIGIYESYTEFERFSNKPNSWFILSLFCNNLSSIRNNEKESTILMVKRLISNKKDIIRFKFDDFRKYTFLLINKNEKYIPSIDNDYFEIEKSKFDKLFVLTKYINYN